MNPPFKPLPPPVLPTSGRVYIGCLWENIDEFGTRPYWGLGQVYIGCLWENIDEFGTRPYITGHCKLFPKIYG